MPRRQTQLRGPKDRDSQNKSTKKKAGKGLDALSIAENKYPTKLGIRRNRLGDDDDLFKRKRDSGRDEDDSDGQGNKRRRTGDEASSDEGGGDDEGREWKVGVDSDNDSELDSDEALGSSDEERFDGFTFRGSSTGKPKPKQKPAGKQKRNRQINLSEDVDESDEDMDENEEEDDDDLGEDAVDLSTAWDMNTAAEDEEAEKAAAKARKAVAKVEGESDSQVEDSDDESSEDNALSVSDDDGDTGNEHGLSKLQKFVNSMETDATGKQARKAGSAQEQSKPTEYGLTSNRKLTVADLLPSVTDPGLKNSLKHIDSAPSQQKSSGIPGKLDAPAPKRQQDRMDRTAAYDKSKETMDRWLETVKANRRAEHIMFPLHDPDAQQVTKMEVAKPQNDLESTIQNILVESGLADPKGKSNENQVQEIEELEERKLPIEEIRARRAELRKRRDLMFREEVRAKRIKKIKSKSYRRVHRKERERMDQQERQALLEAGVDLDEEEKDKNERRRAEARMGSKHKDSKWAKSLKQTGRTAWDAEARQGAADLALREEDLRKRIEGKRVSQGNEDYLGSSSSESEDEDPWQENASDIEKEKLSRKLGAVEEDGDAEPDSKGPYSNLLSMKFMKSADASRKEQNDAEIRRLNRELHGENSQSEAESEVGRRKFGQSKAEKPERKLAPVRKNEFEEPPGSEDDNVEEPNAPEAPQTKHAASKQKQPARSNNSNGVSARLSGPVSQQKEDVGDEEENPWLVQTTRNNRRPATNNSHQSVDIAVNESPEPSTKYTGVSKAQKTKTPAPKKPQVAEQDESEDEQVPVLLKNHDLVKRAFAGDEVVQEFEQEKHDTIEDEGDQVIDNTLPGWGNWTGEGISKKQKKRQNQKRFTTTVEGVKPEERKDAKLSRVIINEKRLKKVSIHLQLHVKFELTISRTTSTWPLNFLTPSRPNSSTNGLSVSPSVRNGRLRKLSKTPPSLV